MLNILPKSNVKMQKIGTCVKVFPLKLTRSNGLPLQNCRRLSHNDIHLLDFISMEKNIHDNSLQYFSRKIEIVTYALPANR